MIVITESLVDCFNPKKTGISFYDDLLGSPKDREYMKFMKGCVGHVEKMTADKYFEIIAKDVFGHGVESAKRGLDEDNIEEYAQMMKDGTVFNLPYINLHPYFGPSQEGRHRMLAMAKAFGDDAEGYVLVVEPSNPSDEEIEEYAKNRFGKAGDWELRYINSELDKYLDRTPPQEEEEETPPEKDYVMTDGIGLTDGDVVDLGDGWARIDTYKLDRKGLSLYATLLDTGEDKEYYVLDDDQVKLRRNSK